MLTAVVANSGAAAHYSIVNTILAVVGTFLFLAIMISIYVVVLDRRDKRNRGNVADRHDGPFEE